MNQVRRCSAPALLLAISSPTPGVCAGGIHCLGSGRLAGAELITLTSTFASALHAYKVRAGRCGQSFEHMVLLEAAVQGWHVTALLLFCPC